MGGVVEGTPGERQAIEALLRVPAQHALRKEEAKDVLVQLVDKHGEAREYAVSASLLPLPLVPIGPLSLDQETTQSANGRMSILLIWHDVTERRIREAERQTRNHAKQLEMVIKREARAEMEDRLATLQLILDELSGGVFLVYGHDAASACQPGCFSCVRSLLATRTADGGV